MTDYFAKCIPNCFIDHKKSTYNLLMRFLFFSLPGRDTGKSAVLARPAAAQSYQHIVFTVKIAHTGIVPPTAVRFSEQCLQATEVASSCNANPLPASWHGLVAPSAANVVYTTCF